MKEGKPKKYVDVTYVDDNQYVNRKKMPVSPIQKEQKLPDFNLDYHPEHILGICGKCHTLGELDFGPNFSWNAGDNAMSRTGQIICFCMKCKSDQEFIPIDPKDQGNDTYRWVQTIEKTKIEGDFKK